MGRHYRKRKKLLTKAKIKSVLEWLALISTILLNFYEIFRK